MAVAANALLCKDPGVRLLLAALVLMPSMATHRVVLYIHGAGETAASALADPEKKPLFSTLRKAGYAIAADDAHGNNWGSEQSVQDYRALIAKLRARGLTKIYILAQSMGGLDGLELLRYVRPVAWAGIYPACNLAAELQTQSIQAPAIRGQILAVYGSSVPKLKITNVRGLRMIFWSSPQDTVVPKRLNTDLCSAEARRKGALVTVISTKGDHGDPSNFQPKRLVRFFSGKASEP